MNSSAFEYFAANKQITSWGVYSTSYGHAQIGPRESYPLTNQPKSHYFSWEKGRVLQEFQLLYISEGEGEFESALSPRIKVGKGTVFILFPGVWHRYRPSATKGWTESWIALKGRIMDNLLRDKFISPDKPVFSVTESPEVLATFAAAAQVAKKNPGEAQIHLGMLGIQALPHLVRPAAINIQRDQTVHCRESQRR